MIDATRRWLRRNRTNFAIGFGVVGVGYVAGQYVLSKITEARDRMAGDRIAKENIRRRFQQNQEDCTITVLELLPTVAESVFEALPSERISKELQQKKAEKSGKNASASDMAPSDFSSRAPSLMNDDDKSQSSLQIESYVHASQTAVSSTGSGEQRPQISKAQLWNDLKISSITRAFTLLYTVSLLSMLTRIQLNLLGRRNYLSSVVSLTSHSLQDPTISLENHDDDNVERSYGNDFETNRKYLTFSWWLLHRGWRDIMGQVEVATKEVFGPLKPTEDIPLNKLSGLILDVRRRIEGSTPEERKTRKWLPYLLPSREEEDSVLRESGVSVTPPPSSSPPPIPGTMDSPSSPTSPPTTTSSTPLRRLLDETADLIDSPMFTHVLTLLLDATFSHLTDQKLRHEAYHLPSPSPARIEDVSDNDPATASARLATIMAVMTREAHQIGSGVPNPYVQEIEGVSDLEGFAAVVYSSNFEFEAGTVAPDTLGSGSSGDEAAAAAGRGKSVESMSGAEAEEVVKVEKGAGIVDRATGVVDAAWGGFESVWGRVMGQGEDAIVR